MKKVRYLLPLILYCSCASNLTLKESTTPLITDLRRFSNEDFFVSTSHYPEKYSPMGIIQIEHRPEFRVNPLGGVRDTTEYYFGHGVARKVSLDKLVDLAVYKALELGANGIMDLKISQVGRNITYRTTSPIERPVYLITGLAIKVE